ncbi:hypothetical protein, partial [Burkholderia multivorans]|uniref:hypothetical protein n=1 Tax=Burkholderia multivorans TaxID=87883 RepID=UPI001B8EEFF0
LTAMLLHQSNGTLTDFRRKFVVLAHGSIFSKVGASSKPGAIQAADFSWPTLHEHTTVHGRCSRVLIKYKVVLSLEDRVCSKIVIVKCFEKSRFLPRSGRNADRPIGVYF